MDVASDSIRVKLNDRLKTKSDRVCPHAPLPTFQTQTLTSLYCKMTVIVVVFLVLPTRPRLERAVSTKTDRKTNPLLLRWN